MENKLYCVDCSYTIIFSSKKGLDYTLFRKKPINVKCKKYIDDIYVIATLETLEEKIDKMIEGYKINIIKNGKKSIIDWDSPTMRCITFKEINGLELDEYSYREASIKECIEHLTPQQYSELYGHILNLKGKENKYGKTN